MPSIKNLVKVEQHRPQFHFTPKEMWMNDPNGMVYYEGEYHLFYQYYPEDTIWGPMHWGHAVSKDLIHWKHLPIALYPDSLGYIFSGSAVVDWNNTSGLGRNGQPPMVAIFTYHDPAGEKAGTNTFQYQGIAYSNDKGRTWAKYKDNPVVPNPGIKDFRDPKVIWDVASKQWVMVLATRDHVKFYGSPDLKKWTYFSDFGEEWGAHGGVWECPDLFPMIVEETGEQKWVLLQSLNPGGPNGGSGIQYFIGDFDGKRFMIDRSFANDLINNKAIWLDYGRDNYAGVTWSDAPNNQKIFIGWMSNWDYAEKVPTEAWRSAMTIPRDLILKNERGSYRLFSKPTKELQKFRGTSYKIPSGKVNKTLKLNNKSGPSIPVWEVFLEMEVSKKSKAIFGIELSNSKGERYRVGFDAAKNQYFSDRTQSGKTQFSDTFAPSVHIASREKSNNQIKMQLFFDVASAELFADDGATVLTDIFFPNEDFNKMKLFVEKGVIMLKTGIVYQLLIQ